MLDQIALNTPRESGAAEHVAEHLRLFWTRDMVDELAEAVDAGEVSLNDLGVSALELARPR